MHTWSKDIRLFSTGISGSYFILITYTELCQTKNYVLSETSVFLPQRAHSCKDSFSFNFTDGYLFKRLKQAQYMSNEICSR